MKLLKKITPLYIILYIILNNFSIVYADNFTYKILNDLDITTGSESIVVMDADTNVIMYAKNAQTQRYPASTTKIMTALLLVEYVESGKASYDDRIIFSEKAIMTVPYDGTNIGQQPNTSLTIEQALYSLMLPSANEIANGIGEFVSGSMEDFAVRMTERAEELGCKNTNFMGASGLHYDDHYTTALDLALIMDKACEYPMFVKVAGTTTYSFERTNADGNVVEVNFKNSDKLIQPTSEFYDPNVVCGKTGYTSLAGHCLVTYSQVNGHNIVVSILNSTKNTPFTDTTYLVDYFKDKYHDITISELSQYSTYEVYNAETEEPFTELTVMSTPRQVTVPSTISIADFSDYNFSDTKIYAPVKEDDVVASCDFKLNDAYSVETDALALQNVKEEGDSIFSKIFSVLKIIGLVLLYIIGIGAIILLALRIYYQQRRKKRANQRKQEELRRNNPRAARRQSSNSNRNRTRTSSRDKNRKTK